MQDGTFTTGHKMSPESILLHTDNTPVVFTVYAHNVWISIQWRCINYPDDSCYVCEDFTFEEQQSLTPLVENVWTIFYKLIQEEYEYSVNLGV